MSEALTKAIKVTINCRAVRQSNLPNIIGRTELQTSSKNRSTSSCVGLFSLSSFKAFNAHILKWSEVQVSYSSVN